MENLNSKQVDIGHYDFKKYVSKQRWNSYYHQLDEVFQNNCQKVLLIGVGDRTVSSILINNGIKVKTFDIDPDLNPDYTGSVININQIVDEKFDCILCCQVLEHIPYEYFMETLMQFCTISNLIILSLPYSRIPFSLCMKIPKIKPKYLSINFPMVFSKIKFTGEHYWEIGCKGYPFSRIKHDIERNFKIKSTYLVPEYTYHRFFVIRPLLNG